MLRSQSFPMIESNMSHSYTLKRCATFPTNVLGLIALVTLPLVWGPLPSFPKSCWALPNFVIYPFTLNQSTTAIRCHPCWDNKIVILPHKMGMLRDPIHFSSLWEHSPTYSSEDIWNLEETSGLLIPFQDLWSVQVVRCFGKSLTTFSCQILGWLSRYNEISTNMTFYVSKPWFHCPPIMIQFILKTLICFV
jgi:hypothetical protein